MNIQIEVTDKKDVYTLLVDEEPFATFHKRIFGTRPKFAAENIEQLTEEFAEKERRFAKNFVLRCMGRKSYHSQELKNLLEECQVNQSTIEKVIEECQGFLDDEDYIQRVMQREKSKKGGPHKILWKMRQKGIEIESKLAENYPVEDQIDQIKELLNTRYRSKEKHKVVAALMRKGFSYEVIAQVLF